MTESEVSLAIEYKVTAHLRPVQLLGMPDPTPQYPPDVAPNDARWCDCRQPVASGPESLVTDALRIGEPEKRMAKAIGEGFEMYGAGE